MTNKTNSQCVKDSVKKYNDAGLMQAKVWVHPEEAKAVRNYAACKPKTKLILKELKGK